jgi:hypothetical protein
MGRKTTGSLALGQAQKDIVSARTVDELREAQAVLLPLDLGLTLAQTAKVIGKPRAWVARSRMKYIKNLMQPELITSRGGRRNNLLSVGDEMLLFDSTIRRRYYDRPGGKDFQRAIEKHIDSTIAISTAYNIIDRVLRARESEEVAYHKQWMLSR